MKFKCLVDVNLLWKFGTELNVYVNHERFVLQTSEAVDRFGERQVRFFHDNVVFLL